MRRRTRTVVGIAVALAVPLPVIATVVTPITPIITSVATIIAPVVVMAMTVAMIPVVGQSQPGAVAKASAANSEAVMREKVRVTIARLR